MPWRACMAEREYWLGLFSSGAHGLETSALLVLFGNERLFAFV